MCPDTEDMISGTSINLPGPVQTVPRAEYYAFPYLVSVAEEDADLTFVTDHRPLWVTFNKGIEAAKKCVNHDLLVLAFTLIGTKRLLVNMRWMPSHLDADNLPAGVSLLDKKGNDLADTQAKKAAKAACVDLSISSPVLYAINLVKRIQNRLATIITQLPNRPKPLKKTKTPRESVEAVMQRSTHVCYTIANRIVCARCASSFSLSRKNPCIQWLQSPCLAIGADSDQPVPLAFDFVHIGKQDIHSSHKLCIFKGVVFCNTCGSLSRRRKLGNLGKQCEPPLDYGRNNLKRLKEGRTPHAGMQHWPETAMLDTIQSMDFMLDETFKVDRTAMQPFKAEYLALLRRVESQAQSPEPPSDTESDISASSCSSLEGRKMVSDSESD